LFSAQRPNLPKLVAMLENFARSGADLLLLGSFQAQDSNARSDLNEGSIGGVPFPVDLRREPFGLGEPLRSFAEPEGFSGEGSASSASSARLGDGGKPGKTGGRFPSAGKSASDEGKTADGGGGERQLLLYSGEYLRAQDFLAMRARVAAFLSSGPSDQ